jgi:hypothetical protein
VLSESQSYSKLVKVNNNNNKSLRFKFFVPNLK